MFKKSELSIYKNILKNIWYTLGTVQLNLTNFAYCLILKKLILSILIELAGIAQW